MNATLAGLMPRLAVVVAAFLPLAGCEPPYDFRDCLLPTLAPDVSIRTIVNMGDPEDRRSDMCPLPVPRSFESRREYGTIKFELWGTHHRLYIAVTADDGRTLDVRGDGIEVYQNTSGSWLAEYSHRKNFLGYDFTLSPRPVPERFTIEIVEADGQPLDMIEATYDTVLCSCAVPVWFTEANR